MSVGIDADDVEAKWVVCEPFIPCQEHRCCANDFLLLAVVNGQSGCYERFAAPKSHFNNNKTSSILHDQVEFAETASKISPDGGQAMLFQVSVRNIFSVGAYNSRVCSNHNSSSANSGKSSSASSLMS